MRFCGRYLGGINRNLLLSKFCTFRDVLTWLRRRGEFVGLFCQHDLDQLSEALFTFFIK